MKKKIKGMVKDQFLEKQEDHVEDDDYVQDEKDLNDYYERDPKRQSLR